MAWVVMVKVLSYRGGYHSRQQVCFVVVEGIGWRQIRENISCMEGEIEREKKKKLRPLRGLFSSHTYLFLHSHFVVASY